MEPIEVGALLAGLGLLVAGAELLVRGASGLAAAIGVSPLVIGLTIVAFGTSSPELAVSTIASLRGEADLALGNVVGSNIFNVLFILGAASALVPLVVQHRLVRLDVPIMIGVSLILWILVMDGRLARVEGCGLLLGIAAYTWLQLRQGRRELGPPDAAGAETVTGADLEDAARAGGPAGAWLHARRWMEIALGLGLLVLGSDWLLRGAVAAATAIGVSELVIGLTLVAGGTSLPELATSVLAGLRGERDIAVGNIVGSNIFNILAILGVAAVLPAGGLTVPPSVIVFDIPIMLAVAVACLPIFTTGNRIDRWEGGLFLAGYAAYATYLVLAATRHDALERFGVAMRTFVIPLIAITLAVLWVRSARAGRRAGPS